MGTEIIVSCSEAEECHVLSPCRLLVASELCVERWSGPSVGCSFPRARVLAVVSFVCGFASGGADLEGSVRDLVGAVGVSVPYGKGSH